MTWLRIDDGFAQHPKVQAAGPVAMAMQIAALCYASRNMTDGFIPWAVARSLVPMEFLDVEDADGRRRCLSLSTTCGVTGEAVTPERAVRWLVANGLWDEVPGGYQIHDYLEWNPSREEVLSARAATAAQRSAAGRSSARSRKDRFGTAQPNGSPNGQPNGARTGRSSDHRTGPRTETRTEIQRTPNPTPTPTPTPDPPPSEEGARPRAREGSTGSAGEPVQGAAPEAPPTPSVRVRVHRDGEVRDVAPAGPSLATRVELTYRKAWEQKQRQPAHPRPQDAARAAAWATESGIGFDALEPVIVELARRAKGLGLLPSMFDELRVALGGAGARASGYTNDVWKGRKGGEVKL